MPLSVVPMPGVPAYGLPLQGLLAGFKRFTVPEYQELVRLGTIGENENLVLIEGYLVRKMSKNPPHENALQKLPYVLIPALPAGWLARFQSVITLSDSEPEPDGAIVRGGVTDFASRHPGPADFGIVIEIADTSLAVDRTDSHRIYARAGIPEYWIVNIPDRQIEVYTDPQPATNPPAYATRRTYSATDAVPVILDGVTVGTIAVADVLP
jgi:Uma2 family endonuclease